MRVFIIDDQMDYLLWADNALKTVGVNVKYSLNDSPNIIQEIEDYDPDSILIDIYMPRIDGISLVKLIKKSKKLKHIPTICLSSSEDYLDKTKAMQSGFIDYLIKPVDTPTFISKVKSYNSLGRILKLCNECGELE